MTAEENKKLVSDHYDAFFRRDAEAVRRQLAADFVDHEMPPSTPPVPEALLRWREVLYQAFPDLSLKIEDIVAEGDRVAVRASWIGTHSGFFPPMNLAPTNRTMRVAGMVFWHPRHPNC